MSESRANPTPGQPDETLVTPRFDEEETVLAQPVVPLDAPAGETPQAAPAGASAAPRSPSARRQWPLALALVSALVGSIVGGFGLYLYQQHGGSDDASVQQSAAPAEVSQPAPSPTVEQAAEVAPEVTAPVETAPADEPEEAEDALADDTPPAAERDDRKRDDVERDDDRAAAAPPPVREATAPPPLAKRGKKGDRDAELQRRQRSVPPEDDAPVVTEGGARRVDVITYPSRRAERQAERRARRTARRDVDRLRAIFEGQPE